MEKFKNIKGKTHWLYTTENFVRKYGLDVNTLNNWRSGKQGEWVLTDDSYVVQVLKRGTIKKGKTSLEYIRTVCGSFIVDKKKEMYGQIAENIYTFSGTNEYRKFVKKNEVTSREVLFAKYIALGKDPVDAYLETYKTNNRDYAKAQSGRLLKTERMQKMVREEVKQVLDEEGVSPNYIISRFKEIADIADRDTDVLRSLECLAKISGLFEPSQEKQQQLTVWSGFTPEQLEGLKEEKLLVHGESDG